MKTHRPYFRLKATSPELENNPDVQKYLEDATWALIKSTPSMLAEQKAFEEYLERTGK